MVIEVADHGLILTDARTLYLEGTVALSPFGSIPYGIVARAQNVRLTPRFHGCALLSMSSLDMGLAHTEMQQVAAVHRPSTRATQRAS